MLEGQSARTPKRAAQKDYPHVVINPINSETAEDPIHEMDFEGRGFTDSQ